METFPSLSSTALGNRWTPQASRFLPATALFLAAHLPIPSGNTELRVFPLGIAGLLLFALFGLFGTSSCGI
jgi:hypothetical protein